jgi:hypothetical protein
MPGRELDEPELRAATIVGSILDGCVVPRDLPGAPAATHDFDVFMAAGRVALEVTRAVDERAAATRAAAFRRPFPAPQLASSWLLSIRTVGPGQPEVKPIVKASPALIAVLERHGVSEVQGQFHPGDAPTVVVHAATELARLGVSHATAWAVDGPPRLWFTGHGSIRDDIDAVNRLAAEHAAKNVKKLLVALADERHLFIWMEEDDAKLAMETGPPPSTTPTLPQGIDVVWVATTSGHLWRLHSPGDWEELPCPRVEVSIHSSAA